MAWRAILWCGFCWLAGIASPATFGTVVPVTGAPTDLVLDEARARLYVVNGTQDRIEVYATRQRRFLNPIPTCAMPLAAALARNGRFLYVACYDAASLDVIDLETLGLWKRVSLPASPEGIAVGADERVLITTLGSGSNNSENRMLLYDPSAVEAESLRAVATTLPAPTTPASTPTPGRAYNVSRSHLVATPDGRLIIGLNNPTTNTRQVFVFEVASGSVLRSRSISNISSVLSVSPDGSRFMAGLSLFDTETLAILAQQNAANSMHPFEGNVNFNTQQNQGGSVFSPDGAWLYTAFNIAPVGSTQTNSSQLMLNDPENLLIQMALQLPENLTGKMVIASDGGTVYALSQSGFMSLPVSAIYDSPIALPETAAVLLTNDQCGVTAATRTARVTVRNGGKGRMTALAQVIQGGVTFTFPLGGQTGEPVAGPGAGPPGGAFPIILPGGETVVIPPGTAPVDRGQAAAAAATSQQAAIVRNAPLVTARQAGTEAVLEFTFNSNAASSIGTQSPTDFLVQSPEAINVPWRIRVYQNNRNAEAAGTVIPVPVSVSTAEGLVDMVTDSLRQRLYIANSGLNRIEVFDTRTNQFLAPIKVGQLPRSLALAPDGNTLYVANSGGESISIINLDKGAVIGRVRFPPVPYNASFAVNTPSVIAAGLNGLQIVMSNGALWRVANNEALPRPTSKVIGSSTLQSPRTLVATPGGEYILLLAGNGVAYLYDAAADDYVLSQQVVSTPIQGYYGAVAAGPRGQYFVVNGIILNQSLTPVSSGATAMPGGATTTTASRIAAVAAVSADTVARFVQPTRSSTTAAVTEAPTVELVSLTTGMSRASAAALEGPLATQVGNQRVNVNARTMAVDSAGSTAYLLTTSGLTIVSLTTTQQSRPQVNQNGMVNGASFLPNLAPGSVVSIFGQNLASEAVAGATPLPKVLGGTCVTLDNQPMPLVMTSVGQINLQVPPEVAAGRRTLVVRSIARNAASFAQSITVSKYAPAVYMNTATGEAAIFRLNGSPVTKFAPAKRDESLVLYATGLGVTQGGKVTAGNPAPADPLAVTQKVQVFFGDPRYKQAEVIVDWSGLTPGFVGLYQINLRVPGEHMKGSALPVTLRIGGVDSPTTGPVVPVVAVE